MKLVGGAKAVAQTRPVAPRDTPVKSSLAVKIYKQIIVFFIRKDGVSWND